MTTAPVLPVSLSPHICVLPSPDVVELLSSCSLPPLHRILQAFAPLSQVTTRSTELSSVIHQSFPLRFSDLHDIETACKEHEDARAGRTIDWIGQRITKRAAAWVEDVDRDGQEKVKNAMTPWWKELQRCTEGDRTPSRSEGWNHPVAVILAVSTLAANPLQAVTELHARHDDLPPWVDPVRMRHTLIIHPPNSPLNADEVNALLNATTKQYGLRTHLLPLSLAHSAAAPITMPSLPPELPPTPLPDAAFSKVPSEDAHHLHLAESDAAQLARFVREFTTMSLVPWMERCVLDWNEAFSSTRRLPSRLFSSTRRLFGGTSGPTTNIPASPVQNQNTNAFANTASSPTSSTFSGTPPQQRRLAEFATFLGDLKLAVSVWEALRKEGRGGSEVLPLLLAASPAVGAHATSALAALQSSNPTPSSQLRALVYAVRWATGVRALESLGGERWLDMAAGVSEEPPPALLLAHAALLSARKGARRRAAMWYVFAAHRLEKCGIKSLTMHFLRKAHELYQIKPQKSLSPSFEDAGVGRGLRKYIGGFDAILPSIEYSLGRLLYTSGDTEGALRYFLGLLKGSSPLCHREQDLVIETDALYVGDFKVAFEHLKSTVGQDAFPPVDLQPPFAFCNAGDTKVRLPRQGELDVDDARWTALEEAWTAFWKLRGPERVEKGGKAVVGERMWLDLMLRNPLDVEVNLADLTVKVETSNAAANIEIEVIDNVFLRSKESRVVPVAIVAHDAASLKITHLTYLFLSLLPVSEPLAVRGARLHHTAAQQRGVVYGPDVVFAVEVEAGGRRVDLSLAQAAAVDTPLPATLAVGECVELILGVRNTGRGAIDDVWIVHSGQVWLDLRGKRDGAERSLEDPARTTCVVRSDNSLANVLPTAVPLELLHGSPVLASNESLELRLVFRAEQQGTEELAVLLLFREADQTCFYSSRLHHVFVVTPLLEVGASVRPSAGSEVSYVINLEAENVSETCDLRIAQVTTASANWSCAAMDSQPSATPLSLPSRQTGRIFLEAKHWDQGSGSIETTEFVGRQLGAVLAGRQVERLEPPVLDLLFCNATEATEAISDVWSSSNLSVLESSRRSFTRGQLSDRFQQLSQSLLPHVFPLRNPQALDIIVGWEIPSERRRGHVAIPGLLLGACHAPLDELVQQAEAAKAKRTMYAETARERGEILEAIRMSEWNAEMDPTVVRVVPRPSRVEHDFSQGDCIVPVIFTIRNFSLTNYTRFVLRLHADDSIQASELQHLPPSYVGSLTRRGTLAPLASMEIKTDMWIIRPGIYSLVGWQLETEVGGTSLDDPWSTRASFRRGPPPDDEAIVSVSQRPS